MSSVKPLLVSDHYLVPVRTGISAAYWFDPAEAGSYKKAFLPTLTRAEGADQTAWFDELFEGGLAIPKPQTDTPLTVMVTGQPGTGKSTLALELCYRLAQAALNEEPLYSVYLTTEGHAPWTIDHARNFRWDANARIFGHENDNPVKVQSLKTAWHLDEFVADIERAAMLRTPSLETTPVAPELGSIRSIIQAFFGKVKEEARVYSAIAKPPAQEPDLGRIVEPLPRSIVVLDNLNAIPTESQGQWSAFVKTLSQGGSRVFVTILDANKNDDSKAWEYLADVVIHLGRKYPTGYMIRTIEIRKARYQRHVYGQHQMKIVHAVKPGSQKVPSRDHPYREEGGIFIFPSMHLALSRRKMQTSVEPAVRLKTRFKPLDDLLGGGGFQVGGCTALAGGRGTHKSRLAFSQVLKTLEDPKARATIISLREDEAAVLNDLKNNAVQWPDASSVLDEAVKAGRLECSYYPPGFIAPEEFFHRVQLSVARHQQAALQHNSPVLLVFNSLDLLHSHYPLCAEHSIFVPALVELLCLENVTSFFVATSERDRDPYGLMSMADPVFHFERLTRPRDFFYKNVFPEDTAERAKKLIGARESLVRMTVERFAGGVSAGSSVFLLLVGEKDPIRDLYGVGLHCFEDRAAQSEITGGE